MQYHSKNTRIVYSRVVTQQVPQQVVEMRSPTTTTATTAINDTTYDEAPPAYIPNSDYQPCPPKAPAPAKDRDH